MCLCRSHSKLKSEHQKGRRGRSVLCWCWKEFKNQSAMLAEKDLSRSAWSVKSHSLARYCLCSHDCLHSYYMQQPSSPSINRKHWKVSQMIVTSGHSMFIKWQHINPFCWVLMSCSDPVRLHILRVYNKNNRKDYDWIWWHITTICSVRQLTKGPLSSDHL